MTGLGSDGDPKRCGGGGSWAGDGPDLPARCLALQRLLSLTFWGPLTAFVSDNGVNMRLLQSTDGSHSFGQQISQGSILRCGGVVHCNAPRTAFLKECGVAIYDFRKRTDLSL